jgi:monooxygenase
MLPFGGIRLAVDGSEVELADTVVFRGMMLSGVPNMAFAFGYTNQSWTLGSDLTCEQVTRVLNYMDRSGYTVVRPRPTDATTAGVPFFELTSGYVRRAMDQFPRQRASDPWHRAQNYARDRRTVLRAPVDDPALEFSRAAASVGATAKVA